jgi:outer membrane protein W
MRRLLFSLSVVALVAGFIAPAQASAQQSINFFVGGFMPRGPDLAGGVISGPGGRGTDDVLVRNGDFLTFKFKDFNGPIVGGGWTVGFADLFDAGIDVGFYRRTSPAIYTKFVNTNGAEIQQDLKLRIIPVTATIRFLPLGHHGPARPYVGAGVGVFSWRYIETGEFLANDKSIFRNTFPVKGTSTGPVVLGGVLMPIGSAGIGFEARWQSAKGDIAQSLDFSGTKIDLGGMNYLFTLGFRF